MTDPQEAAELRTSADPGTGLTPARDELTLVDEDGRSLLDQREVALLDALPHKVWLADAHGAIVHLNAQAREYLGPTADDFLADGWVSFAHPDDAEAAADAWARTVRSQEPLEVVGRLRASDGTYRWHVGRTTPTRDADGRVVRWVGTFSDIHERHLAELALRDSEAHATAQLSELEALRELLTDAESVARSGSWHYDVVRDRFRLSPGTQALLDLAEDTVDLATVLARLHPEDVARALSRDPWGATDGVPDRYRVVTAASQRTMEAHVAVHHGPDGRALALMGTVQDITARAQAEAAARLWAEVAEHAPIGLLVLEADPTTGQPRFNAPVSVNRAARGYALPVDHLAGLPADQAARLTAAAVEVLRHRRPVELGEHHLAHATRGTRIVRSLLYPVPDSDLIVLAGVDVTDQRRIQAERDVLLVRSVHAAETERRRIAEHLHDDVVQLLTAVRLRLEALCEHTVDGPCAGITTPLDAALLALRLTVLELAPFELLASGLAEALQAYQDQLTCPTQLAVSISVAPAVDEVDVPRRQASYRIAQEALTNAHRHAQADRITIHIDLHDDTVVGEVRDDGIGMELTDHPGGHLGLRLMRERAEACGGTLNVGRGDDGGTHVRWRLPPEEPARRPDASHGSSGAASPPR